MCPEVTWNVELGGAREALGLRYHTCEHFDDAGGIADFFLIGDHIFKEFHLLDFLKTTLANGLVGGLRRDEEKGGMVPVGCFDSGHEVCDARAVLGNHHRHFAGGAGVAVAHHASRAFMGAVPECDACFWEEIGDRHHGRANNTKGVFDTVALEDLYEGFFCRHFHLRFLRKDRGIERESDSGSGLMIEIEITGVGAIGLGPALGRA